MNKQDKQLLVKALCGYLPYGIICDRPSGNSVITKIYFDKEYNDWVAYNDEGLGGSITFEKPYLRPMSSMTEEEKIELKEYLEAEEVGCDGFGYIEGGTLEDYVSETPYSLCNYVIDWLNAHHFDYRGLIEKELALEAPDGMY